MVQLEYERAKRLKGFLLSSLDAQRTPGISHFSLKVQKLPIF